MKHTSHIWINAGSKVSGLYYGHTFSGTITFCRPHTMNESILYFVELDKEITVYGDPRTSINLVTGSPDCHIEAI